MRRKFFSSLFKSKNIDISTPMDPDEVFLDSSNLPQFDTYQFEGRIETPISKNTVYMLAVSFVLISFVYLFQIGNLQIANGSIYDEQSENNRLSHIQIFPERGVIYDRNLVELAWNIPGEDKAVPSRSYSDLPGLAHTLGYVTYPLADDKGVFYSTEYIGKDGVEKQYNEILNGQSGLTILETDALSNVQSENVVKPPIDGEDLILTIDSRLQTQMYKYIESLAEERGFAGGAGVIMDIRTGEILAMTSFPEYNSSILSEGEDAEKITGYVENSEMPFLNRTIAGNYTPGSIVKPIMALGALQEKIVTPQKNILSTAYISIENPYNPKLETKFVDWKAHGWVDVKKALAVSSNIYFYVVGGGYKDQEGLGIERIEQYVQMFGLGSPTHIDLPGEVSGVIPNPEWKAKLFDGEEWRIGDTYHTVIGQYGFQVSLVQMVRAIGAIANDGMLRTPHVVKNGGITNDIQLQIDNEHFRTVRQGMRQAVTSGTAQGLNVSQVLVAAKTGTAQVGVLKESANSWSVGFFPYDNPHYSFVVMMEKGPEANLIGGLYVMRQLFDWMAVETPEYLQ